MDKLGEFITNVLDMIQDKRYYYSMQRENEFAVDCSSIIIKGLKDAGINANGATYTGNMCQCLKSTGAFLVIPFNYMNAQKGDIFVRHVSNNDAHAVLYLGNGQIAEACNKKYGLRVTNYYTNRYQYIIRYKGDLPKMNLPTIRKGSKCIEVGFLQLFLNKYIGSRLIIDCDFGPRTAEALANFQMRYNLEIDSICGVKTWQKIYTIMETN